MAPARPAPPRRRWWRRSGGRVGQPHPVVGDARAHALRRNAAATSAARRPATNWRAAARSRCARVSSRHREAQAPCRPATGRESRRHRWPGRTPSAPRRGSASVWYSSQPLSMMSIARSGVLTCTAPSIASQCAPYLREHVVEIRGAIARDERARLGRRRRTGPARRRPPHSRRPPGAPPAAVRRRDRARRRPRPTTAPGR